MSRLASSGRLKERKRREPSSSRWGVDHLEGATTGIGGRFVSRHIAAHTSRTAPGDAHGEEKQRRDMCRSKPLPRNLNARRHLHFMLWEFYQLGNCAWPPGAVSDSPPLRPLTRAASSRILGNLGGSRPGQQPRRRQLMTYQGRWWPTTWIACCCRGDLARAEVLLRSIRWGAAMAARITPTGADRDDQAMTTCPGAGVAGRLAETGDAEDSAWLATARTPGKRTLALTAAIFHGQCSSNACAVRPTWITRAK